MIQFPLSWLEAIGRKLCIDMDIMVVGKCQKGIPTILRWQGFEFHGDHQFHQKRRYALLNSNK